MGFWYMIKVDTNLDLIMIFKFLWKTIDRLIMSLRGAERGLEVRRGIKPDFRINIRKCQTF
jgi:hypothetical protein